MSEHDDDLDYGTPFWAYSDDEDLDDVLGVSPMLVLGRARAWSGRA